MTRNADMMYDTRPPSPHRSRIILGDGSIRKALFVGKLDLVFHSRTDHPVTLHDVSFEPDLGFSLFSFHVVEEKHEIILNKTGSHLLNGRLVFPRRSNRSSLRATRVMPGVHASANNALVTFVDSSSPVQYRSVTSPVGHEISNVSGSCSNSNAGTGMAGKSSIVAAWKRGKYSVSVSSGNDGMAAAVFSPGGLFLKKKKMSIRYQPLPRFPCPRPFECIESHRPTARHSTCGGAGTILGVFDGQGHPRADTAPHHVPGRGSV